MLPRQETVTIAGERRIYSIRRSRRAKHVLLHVDTEGQIEVVLPYRVGLAYAEQFVRDKQQWLQRVLTRHPAPPPRPAIEDGSRLMCLGEELTLRVKREEGRQRASVVREGNILHLRLPMRGLAKAALETWYRREARRFFTEAAQQAAAPLGVRVRKLAIGNHTTQWGSCSHNGRLSFNWRLLLGPRWVAEYVVAHEVAHLVHHNHSRRYWALVEQIYPEHKAARRWLRDHGRDLQW